MSSTDSYPQDSFPASVVDLAELGMIFERHGRRLANILSRRMDPALGVRLDPEDIVNEAFLVARRRWPSYRQERRVSEFIWLYRIINDTFIEVWRKATAGTRDIYRHENWDIHGSIGICLHLVEQDVGPATEAIRNERATLMRRAIALLRVDEREIIHLRCIEELGYAEIAEQLEIAESAATKRYVRALRKLKDQWHSISGESRP